MINNHTLDQTLVELTRTMQALRKLRKARKIVAELNPGRQYSETTVEHAAALRASMDLTRKLAELRQGR